MRTKLFYLFIGLAWIACVREAFAQEATFFRISGPTATTIIAFNLNGTLIWSNAEPGATYTIQTITSLAAGTNWANFSQLHVTQAVNTNVIIDFSAPSGMAFIPAGEFMMGDNLDGESDAIPTNIYVSAFEMDTNLVSYSQWQLVYSYAVSNGYGFDDYGYGPTANSPVNAVNWNDVVKWSNARSQQAGLTAVYYTDAGLTHVYTNGDAAPHVNWSANGYRLPTEAEWEKAARGGLTGQRFPWGDTISWSQANYYGDPLSLDASGYAYDLSTAMDYDPAFSGGDDGNTPYTSPVGTFAPNGYGLNDMAGNVFEWCWDWYGRTYGQPTTTNPTGPATGNYRILRGGDWYDYAKYAKCAYRNYTTTGSLGYTSSLGFRCVKGL